MFRLIFNYAIALFLGGLIAMGIAMLVGLLWPAAERPVFLILYVWWIWTGWKYARLRDRARRQMISN
jgi:hypothetical protein